MIVNQSREGPMYAFNRVTVLLQCCTHGYRVRSYCVLEHLKRVGQGCGARPRGRRVCLLQCELHNPCINMIQLVQVSAVVAGVRERVSGQAMRSRRHRQGPAPGSDECASAQWQCTLHRMRAWPHY